MNESLAIAGRNVLNAIAMTKFEGNLEKLPKDEFYYILHTYEEMVEELKTLPEFQNLPEKSNEELQNLGAGWWDENLLVINPFMWEFIEDGTELTCIDGKTYIKGQHDFDFDIRYGCMVYGFKRTKQ